MAAARTRRRAVPLASIRLLILDVDGVMTDGRLYIGPDGEEHKCFHVRDGYGIRALIATGVEVAVLSGRRSAALRRRCEELGINHLHQGLEDKAGEFSRLTDRLGISARECAYVGDDAPDVPVLKLVGLAIAVADAHPLALAHVHRRTRLPGGAGAVREVCDWLLSAHARGSRA